MEREAQGQEESVSAENQGKQLDMTFGTKGLVTTSFGTFDMASISGLAIQTDGKIVAAGSDSAGNLIVTR